MMGTAPKHPFVPWPAGEVLVLASASPRRAELLRTAGLPYEVVPAPDVEGSLAAAAADVARADPARYAEDLAQRKALDVSGRRPRRLVLGADTIVVLGGDVLEKPRDAAEAAAMLGRLSGRRHEVITAIALCDGQRVWSGHERTAVTFLPLAAAAIARYVATGEPLDKAGAYGIQGYGAMMIRGVEGCYFNVMGLPLALLGAALREHLTGREEIA